MSETRDESAPCRELEDEIAGLVVYILELERAIRGVTYQNNGRVHVGLMEYVDLSEQFPVLRKVWDNFGK